jgi:hypothetical protein
VLPAASDREPLHRRRIQVDGYRRRDGLWEFEAFLEDVKHYDFDSRFRGHVSAGEPVHDMALRVTLDDDLVIREVVAKMAAHPFPDCPGAQAAFQALVGLGMGPGWMREVRRRVGTVAGCTHLFELMRPLATTAYQTILPLRAAGGGADQSRPPRLMDSCHGWRRGGEAMRVLHPRWHEPDSE